MDSSTNTEEIIRDPAQLDLYDLIFEWKRTGSFKEYTCDRKPYRLSIEKVSKKCWWWLLEFNGKAIDGSWFRKGSIAWPRSKDKAIGACEAAYLITIKTDGKDN